MKGPVQLPTGASLSAVPHIPAGLGFLFLLLASAPCSLGPAPQPGFGSDLSCPFGSKDHCSVFSPYWVEGPGSRASPDFTTPPPLHGSHMPQAARCGVHASVEQEP